MALNMALLKDLRIAGCHQTSHIRSMLFCSRAQLPRFLQHTSSSSGLSIVEKCRLIEDVSRYYGKPAYQRKAVFERSERRRARGKKSGNAISSSEDATILNRQAAIVSANEPMQFTLSLHCAGVSHDLSSLRWTERRQGERNGLPVSIKCFILHCKLLADIGPVHCPCRHVPPHGLHATTGSTASRSLL